uniref:Mitochondria-eating protein n=1 Tax=Latimeria chalumnae TaxID=7897 RepID=H2ZTS1_LATCH
GGHYAGVETLKSRFLPWLGTSFSVASSGVSSDTSFTLIQESREKEKQLRELSAAHEEDVHKLETKLSTTRMELDTVKHELTEAQLELDDTKTKSATTLLATEDEILQLRERHKKLKASTDTSKSKPADNKGYFKRFHGQKEIFQVSHLRAAHEEAEIYKRKLDILDDYERQIRQLKDEVAILSTEKSLLQDRISRSRSPSPLSRISRSPSPLPLIRSASPSHARLTSASRHARLVSRFSDIFANERLDAQNLLRRYIDDLEMVQRIIFIATMESFHAAKMAFRQFKLRVRKTLTPSHLGPESLEEMVMDYIVRNLDLYDVQSSVN